MELKKSYLRNSGESEHEVYILSPTNFFLQQLDELSDEAANLIEEKLKLAKTNPYRYKRILWV